MVEFGSSPDLWRAYQVRGQVNEIEKHVVNLAVPMIEQYIRDEALRDLWLSGASPGETDLMRLRYLAVLLKALGPDVHLEPTLDALRRYEN